MKLPLTIIIFLITIQVVFGQTFEKTYKADSLVFPCHSDNSSSGVDIEKIDNNFFSLSQVLGSPSDNCNANGVSCYSITKISNFGDTIFSKTFMEDAYLSNGFGNIQIQDMATSIDSNLYVVGESQTTPFDSVKLYVAKHSYNGNLLWKYYFNNNELTRGKTIICDSNSIYIGGITSQLFSNNTNPFVLKLDTSGTYIWDYVIANNASSESSAIVKRGSQYTIIGSLVPTNTSNNNYRIFTSDFTASGIFDTLNFYGDSLFTYRQVDATLDLNCNLIISSWEPSPVPGRNLIISIDSNNNIINEFYIQGISNSHDYQSTNITATPDSNFILSGRKFYYWQEPSYTVGFNNSIYLQKLNSTGNILWEKEYSGSISQCMLLDSNELILIGSRDDYNINNLIKSRTLIIKVDSSGLSNSCLPHMYLQYINFEQTDSLNVGALVYLNNISTGTGPFSWFINDSLYSLGFHEYFYPADTGWLKVSLVGCNSSLSDSIYIKDPSLGIEVYAKNNVKVFPNPSSGLVHFKLQNNFLGNNILYIYNTEGKIIVEQKIQNTTLIDLSSYSHGVYFYMIRQNNYLIDKGKLIIR